MGWHQHDIDELARLELICLELRRTSRILEERAGLEFMANRYRAEVRCLQSRFPSASQCGILGSMAL